MDVPVEDENPLDAKGSGVLGRDGDVVGEAKTHCARTLGVVAGRTEGAEGRAVFTLKHSLDGVACAS